MRLFIHQALHKNYLNVRLVAGLQLLKFYWERNCGIITPQLKHVLFVELNNIQIFQLTKIFNG